MLDINFVELRQGVLQYLPIGALIGIIMRVELLVLAGGWGISPDAAKNGAAPTPSPAVTTNTHALGELLYTHYIYLFQAAGMILLVAMVGAIGLTHRQREGVKKQNISAQWTRRAENSVEVRKVETGRGI